VRLRLVSDLHYSLPQLDWLLDHADEVEVVVMAGDHLDVSSAVPLETQIVVVRTYLQRLAARTRVVVCSGNHDLTARNGHGEKSAPWIEEATADGVVVDWTRLDVDDTRITVCAWWDGPSTRADVDRQLATDAEERPARWIWIYHFPPDGSPVSWTGERHIGDADLNGWVDQHQPDLVLTGHIHESPFKPGGSWAARLGETWVLNAGHEWGPVPAHVLVDTDAGTAEWWSATGHDTAQLWEGRGVPEPARP